MMNQINLQWKVKLTVKMEKIQFSKVDTSGQNSVGVMTRGQQTRKKIVEKMIYEGP